MQYDRLTANLPHEHYELGLEDGDICGRYPEPDEDQPRGYKPKPCDGLMFDALVGMECDTCGIVV